MKKIISIILLLMLVSAFTFQSASAIFLDDSAMTIIIPDSYTDISDGTDNTYLYGDMETGRVVLISYKDNSEKVNLKKINKENEETYKESLLEQINNAFSIDGTAAYNNSTITEININKLDMLYITTSPKMSDTDQTVYIDAYIFTSVDNIYYVMSAGYEGTNPDAAAIINSIKIKDEKFADTMIGSLFQGTLSAKEKSTLMYMIIAMIILAAIILAIIKRQSSTNRNKVYNASVSRNNTPAYPTVSSIPRTPAYPTVSSIPRTPAYPTAPSTPMSQSSTPAYPTTPSTPMSQSSTPAYPTAPSIPMSQSSAPAYPTAPSTPMSQSSTPAYPTTPSTPTSQSSTPTQPQPLPNINDLLNQNKQ